MEVAMAEAAMVEETVVAGLVVDAVEATVAMVGLVAETVVVERAAATAAARVVAVKVAVKEVAMEVGARAGAEWAAVAMAVVRSTLANA